VHNYTAGIGNCGVNALGYGDPLVLPKPFSVHSHIVLSSHCPSSLCVTFRKEVTLNGLLNGTSICRMDSGALFLVDGKVTGSLYGPLDRTADIVLPPGTYNLETRSLHPAGRHTLWAVQEHAAVSLSQSKPRCIKNRQWLRDSASVRKKSAAE
jgi:hypothetical protein